MPQTSKLACWLIVTLCALPAVQAQTPPPTAQPAGTGSLAGQVKLGEKGIAGAIVSIINGGAGAAPGAGRQGGPPLAPPAAGGQAVTDAEGRFQIEKVAAGSFRVTVSAPGYVLSGSEQTAQLGEGQAIKNLELTMVRGGVITGRITSHGSRPVIDEPSCSHR